MAIRLYYEFFAGGGMVRAGLGEYWKCLFANDIDKKKSVAYIANWGGNEFKLADIYSLTAAQLPGHADLAWASFPCQDLSLAGNGAGLNGERSGTFWGFWRLVNALRLERRAPRVLVLENVCGALTSHDGRDFADISRALAALNYDFGAVVVDAAHFLPQSRPRLFVIAVLQTKPIPPMLKAVGPSSLWHPRSLQSSYSRLPPDLRKRWVWWHLPPPVAHELTLSDLIEQKPSDVAWHTSAETTRLLNLMSPTNRAKVDALRQPGLFSVGTVYKRTRKDERGNKVQRAEIRFDDLAGCLRTPAGGSSRQIILTIRGTEVRSRLLSSREAARLMGLSETYILPKNYNDAYHLAGDGVVVPVVQHLNQFLLKPMLADPFLAVAAE